MATPVGPGQDAPDHLPLLDSLRAVGALAVLTTHTAYWANYYTGHGVLGTVLARLDVGVAVFFVLSGFLLARPWLTRAAAGRGGPRTGRYLWKRLLRIVPLYLLTVVLALSLILDNRTLSWGDRLAAVLMVSTWVGSTFPAGLTHMWSLQVEVSFYLLLPVLMSVAVGRRPAGLRPWRVASLLVVLVVVACWWHLSGAAGVGRVTGGAVLQWLPGFLVWFAAGIALALVRVLHEQGLARRIVDPVVRVGANPGSCWMIAAGLMLVAATPVAGPSMLSAPTPAESLTKNLLYAAVGLLVVTTGVFAVPGSRYTRLMTRRTPRYLGLISYGVFALHLPLLHLVMYLAGWQIFGGHFAGIWLSTLTLSIAAASLTYRVVERPAMRLRDWGLPRGVRVSSPRSPAPGATAVGPGDAPTSSAASGTTPTSWTQA